jgi:3-methyladenine DNA glycosylase AlkD
MNLDETLRELEARGTEQNRKVYARHGVTGPMYGVSYAELGKLEKKIRRDQALAEGLWATGNHDARVLAAKVADPKATSGELLDVWVGDLDDYVLTDALSVLAGRTSAAAERMRAWTVAGGEWKSAAGWNLVGMVAAQDGAVADDELAAYLERIRTGIAAAPNRTRYAMNQALISIGGYRPALTARAKAVAAEIGPVEVDHGETGCKTPDAAAYIDKMVARREAKAKTKS